MASVSFFNRKRHSIKLLMVSRRIYYDTLSTMGRGRGVAGNGRGGRPTMIYHVAMRSCSENPKADKRTAGFLAGPSLLLVNIFFVARFFFLEQSWRLINTMSIYSVKTSDFRQKSQSLFASVCYCTWLSINIF